MTNSPLDKWNKVQQYQNDGEKSNGSWSKENHITCQTAQRECYGTDL